MDAEPLVAADFATYFRSVHGHMPYAWQVRLTDRVLADQRWPDVIDLPSGAGKTAVLDTAVFAMAACPEVFPRRLMFVVDRRIVADQVYERARLINESVKAAVGGVLNWMRRALFGLAGDADSLIGMSALRGGIPLDNDWATRPDQPWVTVSTVDQFGSSLLFRAHGASAVMRPIHAGLAGNDCLVILDELHQSRPFAATLRDVRDEPSANSFNRSLLPQRGGIVEMTATPSIPGGTRFALQPEVDFEDGSEAAARFRRIARSAKRARLVEVSGTDLLAALPRIIVRIVQGDLRERERSIGVIVNRVNTARAVQRALSDAGITVHLITGRMRPLDRQRRLREIEALVDPDVREPPPERTVVVATQAIEVGADFSFDALITEACPLDSLRQRVGRLDRRGILADDTGIPARCWVLGLTAELASKRPDPVYGEAVRATWHELCARADDAEIDIGPSSTRLGDFPQEASAPVRMAPLLLPTHMQTWAQTSPEPLIQPGISDFLHGFDEHPPESEVFIVWRWDRSADALRLVPPRPPEQLAVPLSAAAAWLAGRAEVPVADVATPAAGPAQPAGLRVESAPVGHVLRYVGGGRVVEQVAGGDISPGDVLLADPRRGGLFAGTWDPQWKPLDAAEALADADAVAALTPRTVDDLGDEAQWVYRRRRTIRLDPQLDRQIRAWLGADAPTMPRPTGDDASHGVDISAAGELRSRKRRVLQWMDALGEECARGSRRSQRVPPPLRWLVGDPGDATELGIGALGRLGDASDFDVELIAPSHDDSRSPAEQRSSGDYYVVVERSIDIDALGNDDDPSLTGTAMPLRDHLIGVGERAADYAERLGLAAELSADLRLAGELHDIGKVDRRFQDQLAGHDAVALAMLDEPLAKSLRGVRARPDAWPPVRHEIASVALAQSSSEVMSRAHDADLVLHLLATHHGRSRPLASIIPDPCPQELTHDLEGTLLRATTDLSETSLALDMADRFWRLSAKYGHHGLAWLESIFRLADYRQSEAEADGAEADGYAAAGSLRR